MTDKTTTETTPTRRRAGRPAIVPAGRDKQAELAHVREWFQRVRQDLPPTNILARRAGVKERNFRSVLENQRDCSCAYLSAIYPVFQRFGYVPLCEMPAVELASWLLQPPVAHELQSVLRSVLQVDEYRMVGADQPEAAVGGATFDWFNPRASQKS